MAMSQWFRKLVCLLLHTANIRSRFPCGWLSSGQGRMKTHLANKWSFVWLAQCPVLLPMPAFFLMSSINTSKMDQERREEREEGKKEERKEGRHAGREEGREGGKVWKFFLFVSWIRKQEELLTLLCFVSGRWGNSSGSLWFTRSWLEEWGRLAQALWVSIALGKARQGSPGWF